MTVQLTACLESHNATHLTQNDIPSVHPPISFHPPIHPSVHPPIDPPINNHDNDDHHHHHHHNTISTTHDASVGGPRALEASNRAIQELQQGDLQLAGASAATEAGLLRSDGVSGAGAGRARSRSPPRTTTAPGGASGGASSRSVSPAVARRRSHSPSWREVRVGAPQGSRSR